jgi:hypothetical protein
MQSAGQPLNQWHWSAVAVAGPVGVPAILGQKNALETKAFHPLLVVALFVVVFLEIHPFQDGNGRLSRILSLETRMRV